MKLIIDIDDEVFKRLKDGCSEPDDCFKCQDSVFYSKPYEETPQGEWIEKRDSLGHIQLYCNQCDAKAQVGFISFCGKCGAKMKGGADCMDEDAKQASIPYTYNAPQHDCKCGYPDTTTQYYKR